MTNFLNPHDFHITLELFIESKGIKYPASFDASRVADVTNDDEGAIAAELCLILNRWNSWRFAENVPLAFRRFREGINKNTVLNVDLRNELIDVADDHIAEALKYQSEEFRQNIRAAVGIY